MLTAALKQFCAALWQVVRRSRMLVLFVRGWSPSALFVEFRCARRIDALSQRLLRMQGKIGAMSGHLLAGRLQGVVDGDHNLRRMLAELKVDLNSIRRDVAHWHLHECGGRTGARLGASIAQLNKVAADTYAAADKLEWEIEEHERKLGR